MASSNMQLTLEPRLRRTSARRRVPSFPELAIALIILLLLSSAVYFRQVFQELSDNPLKPRYLYYFIYLATVYCVLHPRKIKWPRYGGEYIAICVALLFMHLLWFPFISHTPAVQRIFVLRLNDVVVSVCLVFIIFSVRDVTFVLRPVKAVVWLTALLNIALFAFPELFQIKMSSMAGRAAGLFWDPNQCATILCWSLPLATCRSSPHTKLATYAIALVAVVYTFSREGVVLWVAAFLCDVFILPEWDFGKRWGLHRLQTRVVVGALVLLACLIVALWYEHLVGTLNPLLNRDTALRIHGGDQGTIQQRMEIAARGLTLFAQHPVLGAGVGSTIAWGELFSVHNMFILMLAEFGLAGGVLYATFLYTISRIPGRLGAIITILVVIESIFSHSFFDMPYYGLAILCYWRVALEAKQGAKYIRSTTCKMPAPAQTPVSDGHALQVRAFGQPRSKDAITSTSSRALASGAWNLRT